MRGLGRRSGTPLAKSQTLFSMTHIQGGLGMRRTLILVLGLLVALAPGAYAQISGGNIYGTVTDESGAALPGAAVNLTSDLGSRSTTSGGSGEFRFLNLDRGRYTVTVGLTG